MNDLRRDCVVNETLKFNIWGYIDQKVCEKALAKKIRDFASFSAGTPPVSGKEGGICNITRNAKPKGQNVQGMYCEVS